MLAIKVQPMMSKHIPSDVDFVEPLASEPHSPAAPLALEKEHTVELKELVAKRARGSRVDQMFSIEHWRSATYFFLLAQEWQ